MERKSSLCISSEIIANSIGKENVLHIDEVKSIEKKSTTEAQGGKTKETSCQTDIEEPFGNQQGEIEDALENGRQEIEKEISEEKKGIENQMRHDYIEIIKAKDEVIRVLTEEKDFFRDELVDLRKSFDLFTRHVHRDAFKQLAHKCEKELGTKLLQADIDRCYYHDNPVRNNGELVTVLRKQEEILLGAFEREKAAMLLQFEREKTALRAGIEEECEEKHAFERAYLLHSIEGLKEGLDCLKIQKHELAKIFEGEKNALEVSFKNKEDELRQNLKLELQRRLIKAQKPWARTKI